MGEIPSLTAPRGRWRLPWGVGVALVCAVWLAFGAGRAQAQTSKTYSDLLVTFAARWCPDYSDIFANKARNDIVESLQDLGPNTQYEEGELVNPAQENLSPQDQCHPLPQWKFTLGTYYQTRAVTGVWGSLSIVTDPYSTRIVTKALTPLLNQNGRPVPFGFLAGAVTIRLTRDQANQAAEDHQLWAQGGTPDDPVLAKTFGTIDNPEYAFGTLRCATDNLNGDNVEYIFFPDHVTHVFCYAYYVKPPPPSGTITITKRVVGAPTATGPEFHFPGGCDGCLSFDPNGFTLADNESATFYRAAGNPGTPLPTWTVTEDPVTNYTTSVSCATASGQSVSDVSGAPTVVIHLAAGDHVTCTYTNTYVPPPGGLVITKITQGGVGTFAYDVTPAPGPGATQRVSVTTTDPGEPASSNLTTLAPGKYTVLEHVPKSPGGTWRFVHVNCGSTSSTTNPVTVDVPSGQSVTCTFTNRLILKGSISLAKITEGATGTVAFLVAPISGTPAQYLQTATTTTPGVAARAVPNTPADRTNRLRLGTYRITEQPPLSNSSGDWTLTQVECNGELMPFTQGAAEVTLTPSQPSVRCVYTDTFSATPSPEPGPQPPEPLPPGPDVGPAPSPDEPSSPWTDLSVKKTASPPMVAPGGLLVYRITVTNHGPNDAENVVVGDKLTGTVTLVSVHSDVGHCSAGPPATCQLGTLKPGKKVTVTVEVLAPQQPGRLTNRVVVGTGTYDPALANNVSSAAVRVVAAPAVTG